MVATATLGGGVARSFHFRLVMLAAVLFGCSCLLLPISAQQPSLLDSSCVYDVHNVALPPLVNFTAASPALTPCDDCSNQVPLGFAFVFYGMVSVSSNGNLQFNAPSTTYSPGTFPEGNDGLVPFIAYFFTDLFPNNLSLSSNGDYEYATLGDAPHRSFIVRMNNVRYYPGDVESYLLADVLLYEGSNEIEFRYYSVPVDSSHGVVVGLEGAGAQNATGDYDYIQIVNDEVLTAEQAGHLSNSAYRFTLQSANATDPFACFTPNAVAGQSASYYWSYSVSTVNNLLGPLSVCATGTLVVNSAVVDVESRPALNVLTVTGVQTLIDAFGTASTSAVLGLASNQVAYLYQTEPLLDVTGFTLLIQSPNGSEMTVTQHLFSPSAAEYSLDGYSGLSFSISTESAFSCGGIAPPSTYPLPSLAVQSYNATNALLRVSVPEAGGPLCPTLRLLNPSLPGDARACMPVLEAVATDTAISNSSATDSTYSWQLIPLLSAIVGTVSETAATFDVLVYKTSLLPYYSLRLSLDVSVNGSMIVSPYSLALNLFTAAAETSTGGAGSSSSTAAVTAPPSNAAQSSSSVPVSAPSSSSSLPRSLSSSAALSSTPTPVMSSSTGQSAGVLGDPQFVGLRGQRYQVHGVDGAIYSLISEPALQLNARFRFLTGPRPCPVMPSTGRPCEACWSHDGSYLSEVAARVKMTGEAVRALAGNASQGFSLVEVNGAPLTTSGSTATGSVQLLSTHELAITAGSFRIVLESVDSFVNLRSVEPTVPVAQLHSHGLLGQTWSSARYQSTLKVIEGEVDDYVLADDDIFGTDFPFNQFDTAQQ